jgi:hypothetical protein
MSFHSLLTQDVEVVTPGVTTSRVGDVVLDWDNPTRVVTKAWVETTSTREDEEMRDQEVTRVRFFLQSGVRVSNECVIEWEGRTFQVDGPPAPRFRPNGLHHLEVRAKEVEG